MAPPRIIDPDRFLLFAALLDWTEVQRRTPKGQSASQIVERRKLRGPRLVQLRWVTDPKLGYPSEPFRVWRRPSLPFEGEKKVTPTEIDFLAGWHGYALPTPAVYVRLTLNVAGASASVLAFSGAPFGSAVVGMEEVGNGFRTISFSAGRITSLLVFGSAALGVAFCIGAYVTRDYVSVGFVAALGFANAMMWPAIFPLAIRGLGRFTQTGSALLVMGIAGGAIIPQLFALLKHQYPEQFQLVFAALMVPCYLYILFFAIAGQRAGRANGG